MKNFVQKVADFFNKFRYKGVLTAVVAGVLGVMIAMNVITPEQQEAIMSNVEYILGLLAALGLVRAGKDVQDYKKGKK